jgi:hypothetical protein
MQVIRLAVFACGALFLAGAVNAQSLEKMSDTVGAVTERAPEATESGLQEFTPAELPPGVEQPVQNPADEVSDNTASAPVVNSASSNAPKDPCEAYMANISAYNVCHDRLNKIDRMKKAKMRREGKSAEPAKTPPATQETAVPKDAAPAESETPAPETTGESLKK